MALGRRRAEACRIPCQSKLRSYECPADAAESGRAQSAAEGGTRDRLTRAEGRLAAASRPCRVGRHIRSRFPLSPSHHAEGAAMDDRRHEKGYFQSNRSEQSKFWLLEDVRYQLLSVLDKDPIKEDLLEIAEEVASGKKNLALAANQILKEISIKKGELG